MRRDTFRKLCICTKNQWTARASRVNCGQLLQTGLVYTQTCLYTCTYWTSHCRMVVMHGSVHYIRMPGTTFASCRVGWLMINCAFNWQLAVVDSSSIRHNTRLRPPFCFWMHEPKEKTTCVPGEGFRVVEVVVEGLSSSVHHAHPGPKWQSVGQYTLVLVSLVWKCLKERAEWDVWQHGRMGAWAYGSKSRLCIAISGAFSAYLLPLLFIVEQESAKLSRVRALNKYLKWRSRTGVQKPCN